MSKGLERIAHDQIMITEDIWSEDSQFVMQWANLLRYEVLYVIVCYMVAYGFGELDW